VIQTFKQLIMFRRNNPILLNRHLKYITAKLLFFFVKLKKNIME